MEFINNIEINKHEIIIDRGKHFLESLSGEDRKTVLSIVEKSKEYLKNIGKQNNVVYSPTGIESASFKRAVQTYIRTDYVNKAQERIKNVSTLYEDIEGVCNLCIRNEDNIHYEMCDKCSELEDFRWKVYLIQEERKSMIKYDFYNAIESTNFSIDLIGNWMLLMSEMREDKESKHIDKALKNFIRDELMNEFIKQNKQLIKKYGLWQNQ